MGFLDGYEVNALKYILAEHEKEARDYGELAKTGNSKGEFKDLYRGKAEAHERSAVLLKRFLRFHGYLEQD